MRLNERIRQWLPWLLLAIAVIVTVGVYWPGTTGGWVFDDYPNIVDNAAIHITRGHATLVAWVNSALSSPSSFLHRPLASLTFSLNWMAGGGDPWPFKVTNIVIHVINGVLVFVMLRALLRLLAWRRRRQAWQTDSGSPLRGVRNDKKDDDSAVRRVRNDEFGVPGAVRSGEAKGVASQPLVIPGLPVGQNPGSVDSATRYDGATDPRATPVGIGIDDSAATRLALIVAAAWMLLPINLMAVLYVVQRMESLCQIFVLAGLWAYLHGRWMMLTAAGNARRDRRGFSLAVAGIVLGALLGLTSKETAVLLPVFAFLAEWIILGFGRSPLSRSAQPLVIPRLSEGQNPGSVAAGAGDGRETDSGSPLRGVRNDEAGVSGGVRNDEAVVSGGARNDEVVVSGSVRNDEAGVAGTVRNDEAGRRSTAPQPPVIPGLPAGQNPGSVVATDRRIWALFTITLFVPAVLGIAWLVRSVLRPGALAGRDFTLGQRLLTEPRVLVDYLHWTLFPNPEVLSLYHDEIVTSTGLLTPWTTLGSIVLLAALVIVAVLLRKRRPLVSLGIGWFFAAQLLTATIIPLELVYEQRMYFASIGVLLAAGALLLGLRWKIAWPLLRGFLVTVALVWFAVATNLRAQEWSNPLRLAIAEANRHPESPRAVYEAGRLLLIASNYSTTSPIVNCPGAGKMPQLDCSKHYLQSAAAIPGSSALADQALIMIVDHHKQGTDTDYWHSMIRKLRDQPTRQEDISALISLTNCYGNGVCKFNVSWLNRAYLAALSRPHPIPRLDGAYAAFQRDILHDDMQAEVYLARAVAGDPAEPAYRMDLAALYARNGQTEQALEQIDALRRLNLAGRLDAQIATLERLAEQGKSSVR